MSGELEQHAFIVLTEPREGREDEFNAWYDSEHLSEILAVPGITSVRRFRLAEARLAGYDSPPVPPYLAIYMIEGEAQAALDELRARLDNDRITQSEKRRP